ncbi:MAG: hypothetical protein MJ244_06530 [Clostridia bacterium]|nr:hypothetical protein [Clostridia bacterium]
MEDKEERILILTTNNEDGECECVTQDGCHANDSCAICNVGMTKQEAIRRIARVCGCGYKAEAALKALLER